jgi:NADPH:quinone reductase-like Zn-dependent oxidoreductase
VSDRRIVIPRTGGADVLSIETIPAAPPGAGEVAIEVAAIGINLADVFCRLGLYRAAPPLPFSPGFEVAGIVSAVGPDTTGIAVGDRVIAVTRFGGYTSRLVIGAEWVRPLPDGWTMADGAAFPVVFLTAYHGLVTLGRIAADETVVVQSAAGGVGTAACQLARAAGARVIGTVGSEAKRQVALDAGAEHVVVSRDYAVWDEIDRLTDGHGVDVVFDAVGGPGLRRGFETLTPGGRLIVYGFAEMLPRGGRRNWPALAWRYLRTPRFNPLRMTESNRTVAGFNLVYLWGRPALFASAIDALTALATDDRIRPVVGRTFPFERVADAHAFLQSRRSTGKVVLTTGGAPEPV